MDIFPADVFEQIRLMDACIQIGPDTVLLIVERDFLRLGCIFPARIHLLGCDIPRIYRLILIPGHAHLCPDVNRFKTSVDLQNDIITSENLRQESAPCNRDNWSLRMIQFLQWLSFLCWVKRFWSQALPAGL